MVAWWDWIAGWLDFEWLNGCMVGWLDGWVIGWLYSWMVGWLKGWMG
jgi:hypothetical protein